MPSTRAVQPAGMSIVVAELVEKLAAELENVKTSAFPFDPAVIVAGETVTVASSYPIPGVPTTKGWVIAPFLDSVPV